MDDAPVLDFLLSNSGILSASESKGRESKMKRAVSRHAKVESLFMSTNDRSRTEYIHNQDLLLTISTWTQITAIS
jgi:hypothetical protein